MFLFYPAMFGITMAVTFPGFTINSIWLFGEEENLKMENLKIPNWSFDNKLIYLMLAGMGGKLMRISFYLRQISRMFCLIAVILFGIQLVSHITIGNILN